MRLKLAVLTLYALVVLTPVGLLARPSGPPQGGKEKIIMLDQCGERGVVRFDHTLHEPFLHPDPKYVFNDPDEPDPARKLVNKNATCAGCHHTLSRRGIPQLWECVGCHKGEGLRGQGLFEGDPRQTENPQNQKYEEVFAERAFHDLCITCHEAYNKDARYLQVKAGSPNDEYEKAPVSCSGCHKQKLTPEQMRQLSPEEQRRCQDLGVKSER